MFVTTAGCTNEQLIEKVSFQGMDFAVSDNWK
ncbi:hypothetical protein J2Y67_000590 [Neobacillus niacini]|nr:hypothetical protein [Neobacillus niacini]